jgi:hypothetical protein
MAGFCMGASFLAQKGAVFGGISGYVECPLEFSFIDLEIVSNFDRGSFLGLGLFVQRKYILHTFLCVLWGLIWESGMGLLHLVLELFLVLVWHICCAVGQPYWPNLLNKGVFNMGIGHIIISCIFEMNSILF